MSFVLCALLSQLFVCRSVRIWDLQKGRTLKTLASAHDHFVTSVTLNSRGTYMATGERVSFQAMHAVHLHCEKIVALEGYLPV